jgi:regulator of RNase E activity RraA
MSSPGFRILPRTDTDRALVDLFKDLPASIVSDNLNRMTGTFGLAPRHRPGVALFGDIMKNVAKMRGFAGIVIDGAIRDAAAYREDSWPCYARGVCHRGPYKDGPGEINVPVSISGMVVHPGDIVVGDDDGVVFIRPAEARAVAAASRKKADAEAKTLDSIVRHAYDDQWIDQALNAKGFQP